MKRVFHLGLLALAYLSCFRKSHQLGSLLTGLPGWIGRLFFVSLLCQSARLSLLVGCDRRLKHLLPWVLRTAAVPLILCHYPAAKSSEYEEARQQRHKAPMR